MKFLKKLLKIKSPEQKRKQTTFCYCPNCKNELIGSDSFISDDDLVKFQCMECKSITEWLFDAPVPILIKVDGNKYYYKKET